MSSQDVTDHYNDHAEEHRIMAVTSFNKDGTISMSGETCSCKLCDPAYVDHIKRMPKGMYVAYIPVPLQRH